MLKQNTLQLRGLVRAASEQLEGHAKFMIRTRLDKIIGELPVDYDLQWLKQLSIPPVINHAPLERQLRPAIAAMIGATNTVELRDPFPFNSEDFSLYQQQLPGVFYWLGVANHAKGIIGVPHLPNFDVDEECLVVGTKTMAYLLLHCLDSCVGIRHRRICLYDWQVDYPTTSIQNKLHPSPPKSNKNNLMKNHQVV